MLQPLTPLAGLSFLQTQAPAPIPVQGNTGSVFDDMWNKIAVATGQVSQADIDAAKATSNSTLPTVPVVTPPTAPTADDGGVLGNASLRKKYEDTKNAILHPVDTATSLIFTSRLIFLVIGLLLVGAGLFQFKTTQTVIEGGTKIAKKGAELFAA